MVERLVSGATSVVNVRNSFYQWQIGVDPFSTASGPAAQGLGDDRVKLPHTTHSEL
jgi:hypothetical protein